MLTLPGHDSPAARKAASDDRYVGFIRARRCRAKRAILPARRRRKNGNPLLFSDSFQLKRRLRKQASKVLSRLDGIGTNEKTY
jgi:hypothetical protein